MHPLKPPAITLLAIILAIPLLYITLRASIGLLQGYSWAEMDWAQKGRTTLADVLAASDIGKRDINKNGVKCTEYYAYKDGLPVKILCRSK